MKNAHDYAVIMAGGIGSRFWPLSRTHTPKQFHDILGTGESLLQATWRRLLPLFGAARIRIVTNEAYVPLVQAQLPDAAPHNLITEPVGRNTAPCIALATWLLTAEDPEAAVAVCPADHFIQDEQQYRADIAQALDICRKRQAIVTLGVEPVRPDTGYGYIQYIDKLIADQNAGYAYYRVKTFTEKPSLEMAKTFIDSGDFVWNSGMFFFTAATMQRDLRKFMPEMAELFDSRVNRLKGNTLQGTVLDIYERCPAISIDYGVMEKSEEVYVIPTRFGWSDLGTWTSLHALQPKNADGNVIHGDVITYDAHDNLVHLPDGKLAVIKGLQGYFVVDTHDALLISPLDAEQAVREMLQDLREKKQTKFL